MMVVKSRDNKREIFVDETKILAVEDSLIHKGNVEVLFQNDSGEINNAQFINGFTVSDFEKAYKGISENTYRAHYYMDGHPEECFTEIFDCDSEDEAFSHIDEMENDNKTVFELQQECLDFKTILKRK